MADKAKLRIFFIFLAMTLHSCENDKNDVIPDVYVDFTMDLNDIEFVNLLSALGSVYVNSNTNNWGQKAGGYDGNGLIIFNTSNDSYPFYAYDRTCPHDYYTNSVSVKVNVIDIIYAECPRCKSKFALTAGGTPLSDAISRYPLKNYRTTYLGNYLRVWNY